MNFLWSVLFLFIGLTCGAVFGPSLRGPVDQFLGSIMGIAQGNEETPISEQLSAIGIRYCHKDIYERVKPMGSGNRLIFPLPTDGGSLSQAMLIAAEAADNQFLSVETYGSHGLCRVSVDKIAVFPKPCRAFTEAELQEVGVDQTLPFGFRYGLRPDRSSVVLKESSGVCIAILSDNK